MSNGRAPRSRRLRRVFLTLAVALSLGLAAPAIANDHDPQRSGHPLRIIAYALHPIGVIVDTLVFRPAHWLVNWEPLAYLFGHDEI